MTPEQSALVRALFINVMATAETVAALFYARLFEINPALQPLFTEDMRAQGRKVMDMLNLAAQNLDHFEVVAVTFKTLGQQHVHYGVRDEDYSSVGTALTWALEMTLGADFTPETKAAWLNAYDLLVATMTEPAAEPLLAVG